jgi:CheY-like chemotaxis protein
VDGREQEGPLSRQSFGILLVEDDDVDAEAVVRALDRTQQGYDTLIVRDGEEALSTLRGVDGQQLMQQPYLILLDINMPRMNGLEFLSELRRDEVLKQSIVFVVSTSNSSEDRCAAYRNQVAGYLLKSRLGDNLCYLTDLLEAYRKTVEFPPESMP